MSNLWRDKDFLLVAGCLVVGLLQVRAQRTLLRALQKAHRAEASPSRLHRSHVPMTYSHPVLGKELKQGPLGSVFGMN